MLLWQTLSKAVSESKKDGKDQGTISSSTTPENLNCIQFHCIDL